MARDVREELLGIIGELWALCDELPEGDPARDLISNAALCLDEATSALRKED